MSKEKVQSSAFRWLDIPNNDIEQNSYMCFPSLKSLQKQRTRFNYSSSPVLCWIGRRGVKQVAEAVAEREPARLWSGTSVNHRPGGSGVQSKGQTTLPMCFHTAVSETFARRGKDGLEFILFIETIWKLFSLPFL